MPATHVLPGPPPVAVVLRRSARARRVTLRVSGSQGAATLTLPARLPLREALAFLASREAWLRDHLGRLPARLVPEPGLTIPIEGRPVTLLAGPGRRVVAGEGTLTLPESRFAPALAAWLKARARDRAAAACDRHAAALGARVTRLTLRDPAGRWGSCTADGAIMLSWRLILAPPDVLDYVAAHEVAHLAHLDHSPAFWAICRGLCPGMDGPRAWLKANGASLHALRLD